MTKPKFLSPAQLRDAVQELSRSLPSAVIAGGYAMHLYGSDRMTTDLDVLATRVPPLWRTLRKLTFGGISSYVQGGIPVDVIVRNDYQAGLYRYAISKAKRMAGIPLRVLRKSELAVIKMAAGRHKDQGDLIFLLRHMSELERAHARKVVVKFLGDYAADDFDSYVMETDLMAQRDRPLRRSRRH